MNKRVHAFISGRVQGVCYRGSSQQKARQIGLSGWVRNLADGRVELVAEGRESDLEQLLEWCKQGPELAEVTGIDTKWSDASNEFSGFSTQANL